MKAHEHTRSPASRAKWIGIAAIVAAVLFWAATNEVVYEITSPPEYSWHVTLRKLYSVVAFAIVGFTTDKALGPSPRPVLRSVLLVAAYSGAIEIVQALEGSHEGLIWNTIDVLCGAIGGWLAITAERVVRSRRRAP